MESGVNPEQSGYCVVERTPVGHCLKREGGGNCEAESGYLFKQVRIIFQ